MELFTQNKIAALAGLANATVNQMILRGVLPPADVVAGRVKYYSTELAEVVLDFLRNEYQHHTRYPAGHVKAPAKKMMAGRDGEMIDITSRQDYSKGG